LALHSSQGEKFEYFKKNLHTVFLRKRRKLRIAERENSSLYTIGEFPFDIQNSFALKLHNIKLNVLGNISKFFDVLIHSEKNSCLYLKTDEVLSNEFVLRRLSKARKEIKMIWAYSDDELSSAQINLLRDLCSVIVISSDFSKDESFSFNQNHELYQATSTQIPSHLSLV